MRKKLKSSSDGGDSGSKNGKRGYGGAYGGVCVWRESGVRRSVLCWSVWLESGFRSCEVVFTFNVLYKEIFINFVLSMQFAKIMLQ
jgi:hypothetical protein